MSCPDFSKLPEVIIGKAIYKNKMYRVSKKKGHEVSNQKKKTGYVGYVGYSKKGSHLMSPTLLHIFNTFSLTCPDPILEFEAILLKIIGFRPWKQRLCIIKKNLELVVVKYKIV